MRADTPRDNDTLACLGTLKTVMNGKTGRSVSVTWPCRDSNAAYVLKHEHVNGSYLIMWYDMVE